MNDKLFIWWTWFLIPLVFSGYQFLGTSQGWYILVLTIFHFFLHVRIVLHFEFSLCTLPMFAVRNSIFQFVLLRVNLKTGWIIIMKTLPGNGREPFNNFFSAVHKRIPEITIWNLRYPNYVIFRLKCSPTRFVLTSWSSNAKFSGLVRRW